MLKSWDSSPRYETTEYSRQYDGQVKIAVFGLGHEVLFKPGQPITREVVTLWYRCPKIKIGVKFGFILRRLVVLLLSSSIRKLFFKVNAKSINCLIFSVILESN